MFTVEWSNALLDYVDCYAKHRPSGSMKQVMGYNFSPAPPHASSSKQGPGRDIALVLGEKQRADDELKQSRLDYRQA